MYVTLAPQARPSGEILSFLLSHYSDILSMIIGCESNICNYSGGKYFDKRWSDWESVLGECWERRCDMNGETE